VLRFLTFDDLHDVLGASTGDLERIWLDSLTQCGTKLDRITFSEFKLLMKGQPHNEQKLHMSSTAFGSNRATIHNLPTVLESDPPLEALSTSSSLSGDELFLPNREDFPKKRSQSLSETSGGSPWKHESSSSLGVTRASCSFVLATNVRKQLEDAMDKSVSPLINNRTIYRKHREMRMSVLEATKQFDKKRNDLNAKNLSKAGLIMKRGSRAPSELEDAHARALFEQAAKRCGRNRRTRNKTVSDVTEMLNKANK
jgi:hypothetical protein